MNVQSILTAECPEVNAALGSALVASAELDAAMLRFRDLVPDEDARLQPYYERVNAAEEKIADTVPTTLLGVKRLAEWLAKFDPHRNDYVNRTGPKTVLAGIERLLKEARP